MDGMPSPPPGVAKGAFMSNADLGELGWTKGQVEALTPKVAPPGGATVGGVFYPGNRWLPNSTQTMILHRVIEFDEPASSRGSRETKYRVGKISVVVGRTEEQIEASWRRFLQRWKRISDRTARFAD